MLPSNARAADVARSSLARIIPVQARKYDAAFQVNGYSGILYNRLTSGIRCKCSDHSDIAASSLDLGGRADSGLIASLLSGGEFGVRDYGVVAATTHQAHQSALEIRPLEQRLSKAPVQDLTSQLPSLYDIDGPYSSEGSVGQHIVGSFSDIASSDPNNPNATTIIESGAGPNGPVSDSRLVSSMIEDGRHNPGAFGLTDASCPICFGSGYVGGFSVYRGWRQVFLPYADNAILPGGADIDLVSRPALLTADYCEWSGVILPKGGVSVDSVRAYQDSQVIPGSKFYVDGVLLTREWDLLSFCDGRPHLLRIEVPLGFRLSHLEVQVNQSTETANFEFPKTTKSANMGLLERTEPFQVILSPLIPLVKAQDIIVESTSGKVLQVKACTSRNDRNASILGWESDVRPTQPQEIFSLLPKRRSLQSPKSSSPVRDNSSGHNRT